MLYLYIWQGWLTNGKEAVLTMDIVDTHNNPISIIEMYGLDNVKCPEGTDLDYTRPCTHSAVKYQLA